MSTVIDDTNNKQTVYIYKCTRSTIQVKGKVNSIILDGCTKTAVVFEDAISMVEFINCQSVKCQVCIIVYLGLCIANPTAFTVDIAQG